MYSTAGAAPAPASPDQMFRPLNLTVSFVHAIVASRTISVRQVEGGYVQNMRAVGGKVCKGSCCTKDVQLCGDIQPGATFSLILPNPGMYLISVYLNLFQLAIQSPKPYIALLLAKL
jgi:hypothetical protein